MFSSSFLVIWPSVFSFRNVWFYISCSNFAALGINLWNINMGERQVLDQQLQIDPLLQSSPPPKRGVPPLGGKGGRERARGGGGYGYTCLSIHLYFCPVHARSINLQKEKEKEMKWNEIFTSRRHRSRFRSLPTLPVYYVSTLTLACDFSWPTCERLISVVVFTFFFFTLYFIYQYSFFSSFGLFGWDSATW